MCSWKLTLAILLINLYRTSHDERPDAYRNIEELQQTIKYSPWTTLLMGVSQKRLHVIGIYGINVTLVSNKEPDYSDLFTYIAQCQNGCTTSTHLHK